MKIFIPFLFLIIFPLRVFPQDPVTPFEKNKLTTATYDECIEFYKELERRYGIIKINEHGKTDIGKPLHLVIVSKEKIFSPDEARAKGKVVLLINNGIHPGEPDGIDASMLFVRNVVQNKVINHFSGQPFDNLLNRAVLIVIPAYNVDGVLNRNNFTRVNQVGPLEYGFRGNGENRDLNRDFIKCDTKNAMAFVTLFREWKPELFVDTHTTDGADYPYKMTYIATLDDKLEEPLSSYMTGTLIPCLEEDMKKKNQEMFPYVVTYKSTPDSGIIQFSESPRYSTGYAALFNTIGFVSESHMLKTHEERVIATYEFLVSLLRIANNDADLIISNKRIADANTMQNFEHILSWKLDEDNPSKIFFKGYETGYKPSTISGFDRLYYDKSRSYEKEINYYDNYSPLIKIVKPLAYIVPQAWWQVIDRLKLNGVSMKRLETDREFYTETYYIESFDTRSSPFEGHYLHSNVRLNVTKQKRKFFAGDYLIYTNQSCDNFTVHVLEPQSVDSYFCWNFFDAILQQKEYFDPYLFEDIADSLLNSKSGLKERFNSIKASDEKFRNNGYAQLKFIYDNTILEPEFMRYPVARVIAE